MKKTNTVTNTNTITDSIKIVGKKVEFVINNDENTELTEKATVAFIEWLKTSFNSRKYTNTYGIVAGGWGIDLSDVTEIYHIGTAYDSITGGTVEMVYLKFENRLLNRIVYLDSEILKRGSILLPIDGKIEYIPFSFKYINGTRKRTTKKSTTTQKSTPTKTSTKTSTNTTEKSKKVVAK